MADVDDTIAEWSNTTASNKPAGSATVGTGWDDNLREIQGVVVRGLSHKGSDIASATTTDLGAVEGLFHDITGTTTITGFGTVRAGVWKVIKFEGILTLTNSASLILPGAANITTADGDMLMATSEGSGTWRVNWYTRAAGGTYATLTGTETLTNKTVTNPANTDQTLTDGATINWDMNSGGIATVTLGGNRIMAAPTNLKKGTYVLHVIQDGTGTRLITWNAVFKWSGATAPVLTTTASRRDLLTFVCDGTNLYGTIVNDVR